MRIISGEFRGRQIALAPGVSARPTADRVREALYNIIQGEIFDAKVLDLFAGSGCIGLEALSRGARHVVFCDNDTACVRALEAALVRFGVDPGRFAVMRTDFVHALERLRGSAPDGFDMIYIDPPYQGAYYQAAMDGAAGLLRPEGLMVVEHPSNMPFAYAPAGVALEDVRRYGTVGLRFYRRETQQ